MINSPSLTIINKEVSCNLTEKFSYIKFHDLDSRESLFQTKQWVIISYKDKFCRRQNE